MNGEPNNLREELRRLHEENERLRALVGLAPAEPTRPPIQAALFSTDEPLPDVDARSTMQSRDVPVLKAMLAKRMKRYKSLRFVTQTLGAAVDIALPLPE